jgi:hypothetical protein
MRGIATQRNYRQHHPWEGLEAALVSTIIDWKIESDLRPSFGEGSDCSDLMDAALTRIKGLVLGELNPEAVMEQIENGEPT